MPARWPKRSTGPVLRASAPAARTGGDCRCGTADRRPRLLRQRVRLPCPGPVQDPIRRSPCDSIQRGSSRPSRTSSGTRRSHRRVPGPRRSPACLEGSPSTTDSTRIPRARIAAIAAAATPGLSTPGPDTRGSPGLPGACTRQGIGDAFQPLNKIVARPCSPTTSRLADEAARVHPANPPGRFDDMASATRRRKELAIWQPAARDRLPQHDAPGIYTRWRREILEQQRSAAHREHVEARDAALREQAAPRRRSSRQIAIVASPKSPPLSPVP